MYRYIVLFFASTFALAVHASCDEFYFNKAKPNVAESNNYNSKTQELCYTEFAVLYSHSLNAPLYSVQRLSSKDIRGANEINRKIPFTLNHWWDRLSIQMTTPTVVTIRDI